MTGSSGDQALQEIERLEEGKNSLVLVCLSSMLIGESRKCMSAAGIKTLLKGNSYLTFVGTEYTAETKTCDCEYLRHTRRKREKY